MKHAYTWGAILAIVLASTTGDVLLSRAMKQVGDVGNLWRRFGLFTVAARILITTDFSSPTFIGLAGTRALPKADSHKHAIPEYYLVSITKVTFAFGDMRGQ